MSLRAGTTTAWTVALALAAALLTVTWVSPAAASDGQAEADLVAAINAERRRAGLHELAVRSDLREVARRHSARMAERGELYHNPNLGSDVCCWRKVGENVGYGSSPGEVHDGFMASSGHRDHILSPDFTEVGVGVEYRNGRYWVTEIFRLPKGATSPEPDPQPQPEPEPAPTSSPPPGDAASRPSPASGEPAAEPPPDPPASAEHLEVMLTRIEALEGDPPAPARQATALGDLR